MLLPTVRHTRSPLDSRPMRRRMGRFAPVLRRRYMRSSRRFQSECYGLRFDELTIVNASRRGIIDLGFV